MIKILQVNLGRARIAHDILYAKMCDKQVDIAIIGEPNIKISGNTNSILDSRKDVSVFIRNKNTGIRGHSVGEGYLCIRWEGWCLFGCYFSPNIPLEEFKRSVDRLFQEIKSSSMDVVVAGDFNSKSPMWGSPSTDARGEYLMEWAAEINLNVVNSGDKPTFERGHSCSYIDITWASDNIMRRIQNWEVLSEEVCTYHNYIYFEVPLKDKPTDRANGPRYMLNKRNFTQRLREYFSNNTSKVTPKKFIEVVGKINRDCTRVTRRGDRPMPYWWNERIEDARKECHSLRRLWSRKHRRLVDTDPTPAEFTAYKLKRKELKKLILNAKKEHWKKLLLDLENDIWGEGYRIALRHLRSLPQPYNPPLDVKAKIIRALFPTKNEKHVKYISNQKNAPPVSENELSLAVQKMKMGTAPGPDYITVEAVKIIAEVAPSTLLSVLNQLLDQQKFPSEWKEASVTLIGKGKITNSHSDFRPICLLSTIGKLYERILKDRLEEELECKGGLSERQFGFRKGRSTVQAINLIVQIVKTTKEKWVALVALDIKNAFNTASWEKIIEELRKRDISLYLINLVEEYFTDRKVKVGKGTTIPIDAGVPQGSVIGPTLWNVLYDGVLDLAWMRGVTAIAYADDLALMIEAEDIPDLVFKANESLEQIDEWMKRMELQLAPQKTEAVVLKGTRKKKWDFYFNLAGTQIPIKRELRYLGVIVNYRLTFGPHVQYICQKVEATCAALSRIMPNVGGPRSAKRQILYGVFQSQILYAIPAWGGALETKRHREALERLQRRILLRVTSSYRTVAKMTVQVLAGIPPIHLLAEEQSTLSNTKTGDPKTNRARARERTLDRWQRIWAHNEETSTWTKTLIPDLRPWVKCNFRAVDYFLSQFLSGHGHFQAYLKRYRLSEDVSCRYCRCYDTPEHAVLICGRWAAERGQLERNIGGQINKFNVVCRMIENPANWNNISLFITKVLDQREKEQRGR